MAEGREGAQYRIGIDVGGTFTHAVAVDHATREVAASVCVPTTHGAANGVAEGILECLRALVEEKSIRAEEIRFVAHSTTQATNALLEGDLAPVTLIGLVDPAAQGRAKKEMAFDPGPLVGEREILVSTVWAGEGADIAALAASPEASAGEAFVVAEPFSVDDPEREEKAAAALRALNLPATATHEVSGLYGLRARTRTSIVNAAILPKMLEVCERTLESVAALGLSNDLMVMRSDGGVMDAREMRRTPIQTMLSGPAAGVSAAILFERMSNGLFVEVGGTSTDISLILNGAPKEKNASVGSEIIYLKTLDVRTVGVAGGSMPRVKDGKLIATGPRSAHIAGLEYACFQPVEKLADCVFKVIAPRASDPEEYAALEATDGGRFAITNTCAANFLGLVPEGDYARCDPAAAREAIGKLAAALGMDPKEAAEKVLDLGVEKTARICRELLKEYKCEKLPWEFVGGGGGASVIVHRLAQSMGKEARVANRAEVISAIGAAMAMLKVTLEKSVIDPTESDIQAVRDELRRRLIEQGARPDSIEIQIEVDRQKNIVSGSAMGAGELLSAASAKRATLEDARRAASEALGAPESGFQCVYEDLGARALVGELKTGGFMGIGAKSLKPVAVVTGDGVVRLRIRNGATVVAGRDDVDDAMSALGQLAGSWGDGGEVWRGAHLVIAGKVVDLGRLGGKEQVAGAVRDEIAQNAGAERFCFVVER